MTGRHPFPTAILAALLLMAPLAAFASDASDRDSTEHAYAVLQRLGLLPKPDSATSAGTADRLRPTAPQRERLVDRVVVDKSDRKLLLLKNGQPVREYAVSLGGQPHGKKIREGDMRTPEGVYTLDWRNPDSRFYKSIHISYPNEQDRAHAERLGVSPGGMIMIHGEHYLAAMRNLYRRVRKDWTEGCIAILNENMDELWRLVDDGTPIEIRP
jgi:murein L,D-transpeptidase YafK